jgi:acetylornithine deacetylase/succinyl-diaminopimelate desuccinylase-like protein
VQVSASPAGLFDKNNPRERLRRAEQTFSFFESFETHAILNLCETGEEIRPLIEQVEAYLQEHKERYMEELNEFLRIPSVSSLSEHKEDMVKAANWLADSLSRAGLENVEVIPGPKHPLVYADWLHAPNKPTVLIYAHYDVQPVDPEHLWTTPPFKPEIRDGKLYARGASDDKGPLFMHIKVIEAWLKQAGELPVNIKLCVEGEEEIGSPHLPEFIESNRDKLQADVVAISDSPMLERGKPSILYGLRGLVALQIDVRGAKSDLHSGLYGGGVANPIHALVELLSSMHDREGRVTVGGFYDDVLELSPQEKEQFAALNFNEVKLKDELQVPQLFGEKGHSYLEHTLSRPTLEINGIWGGFQGEGTKTVLPSSAHAKLTCRLVPNQTPEDILNKIEAHVKRNTPIGVTVRVERFPDRGNPFLAPIDHPYMQAAAGAYEKGYGVTPIFTRGGGSIPVVESFARLLEAPVALIGFSLPDENFHAPDEHFHLENMDKGMLTISWYWKLLGDMTQA